jgi:hypothetical protein
VEKLKKLDTKLLIAGGLLVFFLIIWFVTFPKVDLYKDTTQLDKSKSAIENEKMYTQDVNNFNNAILLGTKDYCDLVKNITMKSECAKLVPNYMNVNEPVESNYSSNDVNNFNMMLLTKDKDYCKDILNKELMQECNNR